MQRLSLLLAVLLSALLLCSPLDPVRAQDDELRAKKEQAARKLLEVSSYGSFAEQTMRDLMAVLAQPESGLPPEFIEKFREQVDIEKLIELNVKIYAEHLDLEEMDAAIEFYESPVGKRYARKQVDVRDHVLDAAEEWAMEAITEIAAKEKDPQVQANKRRLTCRENLSHLGKLFHFWRWENPGPLPHKGAAFLLYVRKKREIHHGDEDKLLCPGDREVVFPKTDDDRKRWDEVDLSNIPADMCSYAVRDFERYPLDPDPKSLQIIACDRWGTDGRTAHHEDGLNVLYDTGTVRFVTREHLGIGPDEPISVGPDSPHPMLKKVIAIPAK